MKTEKQELAQKSLRALYLELPESIAANHHKVINDAFEEIAANQLAPSSSSTVFVAVDVKEYIQKRKMDLINTCPIGYKRKLSELELLETNLERLEQKPGKEIVLPEWIDVNKDLPESNVVVLVYIPTGDFGVRTLGYYNIKDWYSGIGKINELATKFKGKVSHWMPLPETLNKFQNSTI